MFTFKDVLFFFHAVEEFSDSDDGKVDTLKKSKVISSFRIVLFFSSDCKNFIRNLKSEDFFLMS